MYICRVLVVQYAGTLRSRSRRLRTALRGLSLCPVERACCSDRVACHTGAARRGLCVHGRRRVRACAAALCAPRTHTLGTVTRLEPVRCICDNSVLEYLFTEATLMPKSMATISGGMHGQWIRGRLLLVYGDLLESARFFSSRRRRRLPANSCGRVLPS